MSDWDPHKYLQFEGPRLRPALDLMDRIALDAPQVIYDLGCGTGSGTRLLKKRWAVARVTGVDSSAAMLDKARGEGGDVDYALADIADWMPDEKPDLIFSNAALHWLDDHETLFPKLLDCLADGGVLAVQMPNNFLAPSHTCIEQVVKTGPWREKLEPNLRGVPVKAIRDYYNLLAGGSASCDIWETSYLHLLDGDDAVAEWTRSTALKPFTDQLEEADQQAFLKAYKAALKPHYPVNNDGTTCFPFKRIFIVARKK